MTDTEMIQAVRAGRRISPELSRYKEEVRYLDCKHSWREIVCNGDEDVLECSNCGRQRVVGCRFDEDYS